MEQTYYLFNDQKVGNGSHFFFRSRCNVDILLAIANAIGGPTGTREFWVALMLGLVWSSIAVTLWFLWKEGNT